MVLYACGNTKKNIPTTALKITHMTIPSRIVLEISILLSLMCVQQFLKFSYTVMMFVNISADVMIVTVAM